MCIGKFSRLVLTTWGSSRELMTTTPAIVRHKMMMEIMKDLLFIKNYSPPASLDQHRLTRTRFFVKQYLSVCFCVGPWLIILNHPLRWTHTDSHGLILYKINLLT